MQHEYFNVRIRKEIEKSQRVNPEATFSGGDFAPDLMNRLKAHLRKIEEAQIKAVQEYKDVIRSNQHGSRRASSNVQQQVQAARLAARRKAG